MEEGSKRKEIEAHRVKHPTTSQQLMHSEGCKDIMFQTENRVSRGTKPTKTKLKGRESTEGFEDPDETVSDDPLQNLAEAAKQREAESRPGQHESSQV